MAYHKQKGVILRYGDTSAPTNTMSQTAEVGFDAGEWEFDDLTAHDTSGDTRTLVPDLKAPSVLDVEVFLDAGATDHDWIIDTHAAGSLAYIDFQLPVTGYNPDWALSGYIKGLRVGPMGVSGHQRLTFQFQAAGAPTYTQDNVA